MDVWFLPELIHIAPTSQLDLIVKNVIIVHRQPPPLTLIYNTIRDVPLAKRWTVLSDSLN